MELLKGDGHACILCRGDMILTGDERGAAFDDMVEAIKNRTNTGSCPMESAVMEADESDIAL